MITQEQASKLRTLINKVLEQRKLRDEHLIASANADEELRLFIEELKNGKK